MKHQRKTPAKAGAEYQNNLNKLYGNYNNSITAEQIANALNAKRCGNGWMACCPAHDDKTPSLRISESTDGRVLVHCFAGCSQKSVIDALRSLGLWHSVKPEIAIQRQRNHKIEKLKSKLNMVKMIADADRASGRAESWSDEDKCLATLADKTGGSHE